MWTTRIEWTDGQNRVVLLRDGLVVATMTLDEWAKLPVTKYLAEEHACQNAD